MLRESHLLKITQSQDRTRSCNLTCAGNPTGAGHCCSSAEAGRGRWSPAIELLVLWQNRGRCVWDWRAPECSQNWQKKTSGAWLSTKFLLDWCSAGHSFCTDVWQLVLHLACLGTTDKKETQTSKWLFALAGEPVNIKKQTASQHDAGVAEMPRACSQPCHRHTLQSHVQESTRILRGFILITTERSDISWIFMLPFPFPCTFVIFKKGTAGKAQAETLQEEDQYLLPLFLKAQKWDVLPSAVQGAPLGITYQRDSTEQESKPGFCLSFFPLPFSSFPSLGRSLGTRSTKAVCHLNFCCSGSLSPLFSSLSAIWCPPTRRYEWCGHQAGIVGKWSRHGSGTGAQRVTEPF